MKILIVDDEQLARERLIDLIREIGREFQLAEASNGVEALDRYNREQADLILLDIRMPKMDGLETAAHLCKLDAPPAVVFTTAYQDHALEAFEAQAIDYLLKPIRLERLRQAIHKAQVIQLANLAAIQNNEPESATRSHISAKSKHGLKIVALNDVYYFKAEQKYVSAFWTGGELILDEPLKELEAEFGEHFIRIHRNTLVAKRTISGLEKAPDGNTLLLLNGRKEKLPISRRHSKEIKQYLKSLT